MPIKALKVRYNISGSRWLAPSLQLSKFSCYLLFYKKMYNICILYDLTQNLHSSKKQARALGLLINPPFSCDSMGLCGLWVPVEQLDGCNFPPSDYYPVLLEHHHVVLQKSFQSHNSVVENAPGAPPPLEHHMAVLQEQELIFTPTLGKTIWGSWDTATWWPILLSITHFCGA